MTFTITNSNRELVGVNAWMKFHSLIIDHDYLFYFLLYYDDGYILNVYIIYTFYGYIYDAYDIYVNTCLYVWINKRMN